MLIRTYADIEKLEGDDALSPAEKALIENCKRGEPTKLGDGTRPEGPSQERIVRADLLRYLILGGCDQCRVHEWGVQLLGGWIAGKLDLSFAQAKGAVHLLQCAFEAPLVARQAQFDQLALNGSSLPALEAQGARVRGGVLLRELKSAGEVSFSGAEIGGQLSCNGAELNGGKGCALNAQGVTIRGGVFLRDMKSRGEISFSGADINVQLEVSGAELDGEDGLALNMQRLVLRGGLYWWKIKNLVGTVDLAAAQLGDLADDEQSWSEVSSFSLFGLTYENIAGPLDLSFRKDWLKKGANINGQFHPQPYQQLAKFYRETGHRHEAREILIEKEKEQRRAVRAAIRNGSGKEESALHPSVRIGWNWFWDILTRWITGYGYKPWLSFGPLLTLVAAMAILSQITWSKGDFAPNSDVILTSPDWKAHADGPADRPPSDKPAVHWSAAPDKKKGTLAGPGRDYETFNALAYAVDVVVPVLNLGQTAAWAPSTSRGPWGRWLFYLQKLFIIAGWGVTAIVAAAVTGMIRRDD